MGKWQRAQSQINWSVVEQSRTTAGVVIRSVAGEFLTPDQDTSLGQNTNQLIQAGVMVEGSTSTFLFNESLTIPLTVIRRAQQLGINQFIYRRTFSDSPDNTGRSNQVTFQITGDSNAGELTVKRIQMQFDDSKTTTHIGLNEKLQARAIVNYKGTGLLEYSWDIATPPSTQGQPIFSPLTIRKQYLLAGDQVILQSPNLPALRNGNYFLRLNIYSPSVNFSMPTIRYNVLGSSSTTSGIPLVSISTLLPAVNTLLVPETEFVWQPLTGAKVYQLETYDRPVRDNNLPGSVEQVPLTGVLIPATKNRLKIRSLARSHITKGQRYYWRVVAISENGDVIGRSEYKSIQY